MTANGPLVAAPSFPPGIGLWTLPAQAGAAAPRCLVSRSRSEIQPWSVASQRRLVPPCSVTGSPYAVQISRRYVPARTWPRTPKACGLRLGPPVSCTAEASAGSKTRYVPGDGWGPGSAPLDGGAGRWLSTVFRGVTGDAVPGVPDAGIVTVEADDPCRGVRAATATTAPAAAAPTIRTTRTNDHHGGRRPGRPAEVGGPCSGGGCLADSAGSYVSCCGDSCGREGVLPGRSGLQMPRSVNESSGRSARGSPVRRSYAGAFGGNEPSRGSSDERSSSRTAGHRSPQHEGGQPLVQMHAHPSAGTRP